ncbi:hypothetical protein [Marinobacter nauticus]|jgi:hypothetical protein|uniref:hypothetical protein n=1 Tax=Marinobacter nauticus TaxID=2743 RepID=UPI003735B3E8
MKGVTRDFVTLFNVLWYRDFPLARNHKEMGSRAEWTTHIGICVRAAGDLLGYFTYFEYGNRTDAVMKNNKKETIANLEWEWAEPRKIDRVNEIAQLKESSECSQFSVFVGYFSNRFYYENKQAVLDQWDDNPYPLVLIAIRFDGQGKKRIFTTMETFHIQNGRCRKLRSQPALPWHASGKRWEAYDLNSSKG